MGGGFRVQNLNSLVLAIVRIAVYRCKLILTVRVQRPERAVVSLHMAAFFLPTISLTQIIRNG